MSYDRGSCPQPKYIESEPEVLPNAPTNGNIPRTIGMTTGGVVQTPTEHGESHTFQYTIDLSPPPKKTKTKRARKAKPKVTKPPKQRVSITPEERTQRRQAYEQARNKLPHRREQHRVEAKERHRQAKELGLCRTCRSPAMPGQTRCQDCIEKRRLQRIQAKEKATQQRHEALDQPLLF